MELVQSSVQMWATFAVILTAIIFYAMDRIPMEITSLGTITTFLILFHFMPMQDPNGLNLLDLKNLLAGFADPALITILSLLVIGQGMVQTGALDTPAQIIVKHAASNPRLVVFACLVTVMVISALLNNTPVVVIFIPIMITLMDKMDKPAGLVLMPLSFVAILGGMTTLIGSSTNLLVAGAYKGQTGLEIGFFDFTVPGLFLATLGLAYITLVAPIILPKKLSPTDEGALIITGKQFIVQLDLIEGNSLIGKKSVAGMFPDLSGMTVRLVQRGAKAFLPPFDDISFQVGDSIILATTRAILTEKLGNNPDLLTGILTAPDDKDEETDTKQNVSRGQKTAEVIVAPASRLDGRTLEQVGYHLQGGCKVLGIQRRSRMIRTSMDDIRLEAGDVLLVVGTSTQLNALRMNKDVLLMEWSTREVPTRSDSWKALGIFAGVVTLAASGFVPITIAATGGAFLMIAIGCLNIRQAGRAVDRRIFMLIGAASPASRLDGRTLEQVGYHLQGGCKVLGIQRRSRMIRTSMDDIRLEAGDVLLVVGTSTQLNALRMNKDVLLMEWSTREVPTRSDSWKALGIFAGVVTLAASGFVPITIAATGGAFLMIAIGCLNIRQAGRAVDRRIFMLIGAALAMGTALQATGGAAYLAESMIRMLEGTSIAVTLSAFFLLIALLTNMLSNNATAVLFTPIAINIAHKLAVDPMIFVTTVIFAANCSFATPMGYQTNLLVMRPGNYKFKDFFKVGVPLILVLWVGYSFFAPWYFGL